MRSLLVLAALASPVAAQFPFFGIGRDTPAMVEKAADKLLAMGKGGKVTKADVKDERYHPLLERAGIGKKGHLTRDDLLAALAKDHGIEMPVTIAPESVRGAVKKALPLLRKGMAGHSEETACFTCHSHAMPMLALETARKRGFDVTKEEMAKATEFVTDYLELHKPRFLKGLGPGPFPSGGGTDTTGYALFILERVGHAPDERTTATVEYTLATDKRLGYWWTPAPRPPSEASSFMTTALAIRGVKRYVPEKRRDEAMKRIEKAKAWLAKTAAKDTEDRVYRLMGLKAAGADEKEIGKAMKELLATQRDDGGWAQTDKRESDAYATGSALFVLNEAGMKPDARAWKRGVAWLLKDQKEDGSWHVKTRSPRVQKYFETGYPHGEDQFISMHAAGWAATVLALHLPEK